MAAVLLVAVFFVVVFLALAFLVVVFLALVDSAVVPDDLRDREPVFLLPDLANSASTACSIVNDSTVCPSGNEALTFPCLI